MARELTSEAAESARLAKRAIASEDKALKGFLYKQFVNRFATLLHPKVKKALEEESVSEIAQEWIEEATAALKAAVPELPEDLQNRAEFQKAMDNTRQSLTRHFCNEVIKPSSNEIQRESIELAQCILANWFSVLEHAKADTTDDSLRLLWTGIPVNASLDDLFRGTEAFCVPHEQLPKEFDNFVKAEVPSGDFKVVAPRLVLARTQDDALFLTWTEERARQLARRPAALPRAASSTKMILGALLHLLTKRKTSFGSRVLGTRYFETARGLSPGIELVLAQAAAHRAQRLDSAQPLPGKLRIEGFSKLSEELATMARLDLVDALSSNPLHRILYWTRRLANTRIARAGSVQEVSGEMMKSLRLVSALASGYVVACPKDEEDVDALSYTPGLTQILEQYPDAQKVIELSAAAAHQVSEMPEAEILCSKLQIEFSNGELRA